MQIGSLSNIRQCKIQVEPHAYHFYRSYVDEHVASPHAYYARLASPGAFSDSDYESETEEELTNDTTRGRVDRRPTDFLHSMEIHHSSGRLMADQEPLYELRDQQEHITILIDLSIMHQ